MDSGSYLLDLADCERRLEVIPCLDSIFLSQCVLASSRASVQENVNWRPWHSTETSKVAWNTTIINARPLDRIDHITHMLRPIRLDEVESFRAQQQPASCSIVACFCRRIRFALENSPANYIIKDICMAQWKGQLQPNERTTRQDDKELR